MNRAKVLIGPLSQRGSATGWTSGRAYRPTNGLRHPRAVLCRSQRDAVILLLATEQMTDEPVHSLNVGRGRRSFLKNPACAILLRQGPACRRPACKTPGGSVPCERSSVSPARCWRWAPYWERERRRGLPPRLRRGGPP